MGIVDALVEWDARLRDKVIMQQLDSTNEKEDKLSSDHMIALPGAADGTNAREVFGDQGIHTRDTERTSRSCTEVTSDK